MVSGLGNLAYRAGHGLTNLLKRLVQAYKLFEFRFKTQRETTNYRPRRAQWARRALGKVLGQFISTNRSEWY